MLEVLKEIDRLRLMLEEKNKTTDVLNRQLQDQKSELETLKAKALAKFNHAAAMERVYKKYEDFDNEVRKFNIEKVDYSKQIKELEDKEKSVSKLKKDLDKQQEEVDAKLAAHSKKVIAFKEREAGFDKKKDELKGLISGQAIKDLLK